MSMFRKFRTGSPQPPDVGRHGTPTSPPAELQGDAQTTHPGFPFRSKSEPDQAQLLLQSSQTGEVDRRLSGASATLIGSSTSYPAVPRRHTTREGEVEDPMGLTFIHGPPAPSADIIFVHGLGGSSIRTWSWERNPDIFWPGWLLNEEGLSNFRVFSYGYNANFRNSENPLSIMDFSRGLLIGMKTYGRETSDDIGLRPIVFVAHSMGGLVVKKALIIGKNDDHFSKMLSKVHGIMFFSTPHKGTSHARTLNSILSVMVGSSTKVYVSELESSSTSIEDISEQFRTICSQLQLVSLYENMPTKLVSGVRKLIVGKDSGVLNYPNEMTGPVDADHHTICKFSNRLDPNYLLSTNLLRQVTRDLRPEVPVSVKSTHVPTEDNTQLLRTILGIQGNIGDELDSALAQTLPGSCEWLHKGDTFKRWLNGTVHYSVLWYTGLPGSGKSTIAAKTIDHIQKAGHCQFHFFIASQPAKRNAAYCVRALAFQLAMLYPALSERLIQLHKETQFSAASQKLQVVWDTIFEDIIFKMDFGSPLHWVFDGLDEADMSHLLIRNLLQMRPKTPIKLFLLSRPKRDLTSLTGPHSDSVFLEAIAIQHTLADMENYIDSVVTEVLPQDEALKKFVVDQIAKRAEGSFLWTKLALDSLWDNWHTQADIEMALNNVPNELQALYDRMMDNVKGQTPRLREIAFRVLNWAACSFRPLAIAELAVALKPEFDGFVNLGETAVQICGQFVRIDHDTVSLIHGTARQFLLRSSVDTPLGHEHLAIVCLRYLSQNTWRQALARVSEVRTASISSDRLEPLYDEYPFMRYSINFWAYHVSLSSANSPDLLLHLRLFCNKYMLLWIQAVALSGNLRTIPRAAQYLKKWLRQKRKAVFEPLTAGLSYQGSPETAFLEKWSSDLIRLVAKFGASLAQSPSIIHRHVPPFCPEASTVAATYHQKENALITVDGLSGDDWDDNLARLSVGQEEIATIIRSAGVYFLALIPRNGTVIVWHSETCEELRRICHGEWARLMETTKTGNLVATAGRFTTRIWDTSTGQQLYSLPKQSEARLMSLNFATSGTTLVMGYDDCSLLSHNFESSTDATLLAAQGPDELGDCPRFVVLSPDQTKLAIGFRGRPVLVWDIAMLPRPESRSVIRLADRNRPEGGDEAFNSPETTVWQADGAVAYILYQDNTILVWNLIDDTQSEFEDTEAREMALNESGTCLLTSSNRGSVSVWGLPRFNLIYRLQSDEFVRSLTFSPDSQRIYDVRGSGCNVWAPDVLVRLEEVDPEEKSSSFGDSVVSDVTSEPVFAEDKSMRGRITALACDDDDEFFCCGRDDGSVSIHEMNVGKRVRKVTSHATGTDVVAIAWSPSRRFIASADDSGRLIAKRLRIKEDNKWAVYPLFDLRVSDVVSQLLFSLDEAFLLVSTDTADHVWDLEKKVAVCTINRRSRPGWKWVNHPDNESQLICLEPNQVSIHAWKGLSRVDADGVQLSSAQETTESAVPDIPSVVLTGAVGSEESVDAVVVPENNRFLLYEVLPERRVKRGQSNGVRFDLIEITNLTAQNCTRARRKTLIELGAETQHLLGSFRDRAVFLDNDNWVCTSPIGWETGSRKRHFFLPSHWINDATLPLILVNGSGTLLCARYGEVAIVRYGGRL